MKLAYLLAQYLYTHRRLDLPGIGSFILDSSVIIDTDSHKHRAATPEGISFQNNPSIQRVPDLVEYISSKAGKMKVLAESDLESHLQMIQQFLNINKPFSFDGIGTLVKVKQGEYEFTPGNIIATNKLRENPEKEKQVLTKKETVEDKYQTYLATPVIKSRWAKPVVALLVLCGIGLAIWGGYTISTNRSAGTEATLSDNATDQSVTVADSTQSNKKDSSVAAQPVASSSYKYVLEITKATKAFKRYKQLQDTRLAPMLQLETSDSVQYKLFVLLPVRSDTTKVIDSLTAFLGKKVYIERQN